VTDKSDKKSENKNGGPNFHHDSFLSYQRRQITSYKDALEYFKEGNNSKSPKKKHCFELNQLTNYSEAFEEK